MSAPACPTGTLGPAELVRFARALADSPERWRNLVIGEPCVRVYETLWSDDHVNAWVIRWPDDADTGFHDHDTSAAAIIVIEGSVFEERLALAGPPLARHYAAGAAFHLPASAIHRVRHGGGQPALTVHAYSPPLRHQGVYRVGEDGALEREAAPYTDELRAQVGSLRG